MMDWYIAQGNKIYFTYTRKVNESATGRRVSLHPQKAYSSKPEAYFSIWAEAKEYVLRKDGNFVFVSTITETTFFEVLWNETLTFPEGLRTCVA